MPDYSHGDYAGRHVTPHQQRLRVMAAGATPTGLPGTGALLAARQAGKYAPPGQHKRAVARQLTAPAIAAAGLLGGVRAGAKLAVKSPRAERVIRGGYKAVESRLNPRTEKLAQAHPRVRKFVQVKPSAELNPRGIGAVAGGVAGKTAAGAAATQVAISRNLHAQDKYNAHHRVSKAVDASGMTDKQKGRLVRRKRLSADLTTVTGAAGLGALALVGAKHPAAVAHREKLLAVGAGTGGINAFNSAGIARREARAEKATISKHDMIHLRIGAHTGCGKHLANVGHTTVDRTKVECERCKLRFHPNSSPSAAMGALDRGVSKAQPIQTTMTDKDAHRLVHGKGGYGLVGPLPKTLDRPTRQQAYEARYVAAGGKKSQRWQQVAQAGGHVANAGVAGGTAAGGAWLAAGSPKVKKYAAPLHKLKHFEKLNEKAVKHHAERAAVGAAVIGGVGQLTVNHARRKRASYASAPGGVAASALSRMQQYTPPGG